MKTMKLYLTILFVLIVYCKQVYTQTITRVLVNSEVNFFEFDIYTDHSSSHNLKSSNSYKSNDTMFVDLCYFVTTDNVPSKKKFIVHSSTHQSKYNDYFVQFRAFKTHTNGSCSLDSIVDFKFYSVNSLINSVESPISKQTRIYPTPTKGQLFIELPENTIAQRVYLLDLTGKLVKELPNNESRFNLSTLPNGYYYLKVETNKGIIAKKVLKI